MLATPILMLGILMSPFTFCIPCDCTDPAKGSITICEGADTSQTKITITDQFGSKVDFNVSDDSDSTVGMNIVCATPKEPYDWGDVYGPPTDCGKLTIDCDNWIS